MQKNKATASGYSYSYLKLKPIILYIFDFKCVVCGVASYSNHVHHLDHNSRNNCPTNLVCVCPDCHKLLHKFNYDKSQLINVRCMYKLKALADRIAKIS